MILFFIFANCFGCSLILENLDPTPPNKIMPEFILLIFFEKTIPTMHYYAHGIITKKFLLKKKNLQ